MDKLNIPVEKSDFVILLLLIVDNDVINIFPATVLIVKNPLAVYGYIDKNTCFVVVNDDNAKGLTAANVV